MRTNAKLLLGIAAAILLIGGIVIGISYLIPKPLTAPQNVSISDGISVDGGRLVRDGAPFIVKGLHLNAFTTPPSLFGKEPDRGASYTELTTASTSELAEMKSWGANTIRFQIDQEFLDSEAQYYSASMLAEIVSAVKLARSEGFVALVSDQDNAGSSGNNDSMPNQGTLRADLELGKLFGNDPGVIIELYNEPGLAPSASTWNLWLDGGTDSTTGTSVVGMQTIINQVRAAGVKNVLAVDGLMFAKSFEGAPAITDPLNQFFYAVHPYLPNDNTQALWQARFGYLADEGKPVVVTEWNASTGRDDQSHRWCKTIPANALADEPTALLNFLASKHIGMVAYAFDLPDSIVTDLSGTPSTYVGKACGDADGGPGTLIQQQFKILAPAL